MSSYALVQSGLVAGLVMWDGNEGEPPEDGGEFVPFSRLAWPGFDVIELPEGALVGIGDRYENGNFSSAPAEVPEIIVPSVVTMRQACRALFDRNLLASVDVAIASLPSPQKEHAQIDWQRATTVERDSPTAELLATALGLDDAELDALFIEAAAI